MTKLIPIVALLLSASQGAWAHKKSAAPDPTPPAVEVVEEGEAHDPAGARSVLGSFHPVAVHFPIALVLAAFVAEASSLRRAAPDRRPIVRFCLIGGVAGALVAAPLGWIAAAAEPDATRLLLAHRAAGLGTAGIGMLLLVILSRAERSGRRTVFRAFLAFEAALVTVTGMLGGALVHGLDHIPWSFQ